MYKYIYIENPQSWGLSMIRLHSQRVYIHFVLLVSPRPLEVANVVATLHD